MNFAEKFKAEVIIEALRIIAQTIDYDSNRREGFVDLTEVTNSSHECDPTVALPCSAFIDRELRDQKCGHRIVR